MKNFGDRLKFLRLSRELTADELADAAGIKAATVKRIERRGIRPTLETVKKLSAALNVKPALLLDNDF